MSENRDDFADVIQKNRGIYGAENATLDDALGELDSVKHKVLPDGVAFEGVCHGCRNGWRYTVEYPEMVALKFRVPPTMAFAPQSRTQVLQNPQSVVQNPGTWTPVRGKGELRCGDTCRCGWNLRLTLTFREPEMYLTRARSQQYVDPNMERAVQQHCAILQGMHRR